MASVSVDPVSNQFHIRFRFAGQAFKRSLKTESLKEATAALARVEETLSLLQRGVLELPADADPATFLLSAGKTRQRPQKAEKALTLGQLIDSYLKSLPEQAKEKTTLKTEATHIKHFRARLPMSKPVDLLTTNDVQQFINSESRRKVRAKFISPDTIKRHMDTLKCILNWAVKQELVKQVTTFSRKHTANVHDALPEITGLLKQLVASRDQRRDAFVRQMTAAQTSVLGQDQEETMKALSGRGIPQHVVKEAMKMVTSSGSRFTVFALVDALTRISGRIRQAGDRAELDARIGRLLTLAV